MPFRYAPKGNRTPVHDLATGLHLTYGSVYDEPSFAGREGFEEVKEEVANEAASVEDSSSEDQAVNTESVAETPSDEAPQKRASASKPGRS